AEDLGGSQRSQLADPHFGHGKEGFPLLGHDTILGEVGIWEMKDVVPSTPRDVVAPRSKVKARSRHAAPSTRATDAIANMSLVHILCVSFYVWSSGRRRWTGHAGRACARQKHPTRSASACASARAAAFAASSLCAAASTSRLN